MSTIQLIQVTPNELANLISENVKMQIQDLAKGLSDVDKPHQKEVVSRKEVAEMFDVSLVTIHDWIKSGILTPYKIGGRTYFKRTELMELLINSKGA
jgi:excisionase family DNA binding protein